MSPITLLIWVIALAAEGCPSLPPPDNCPPRAQRCSPVGAPEVCSPQSPTRWTPMNRPCQEIGAQCREVPSVYDSTRMIFACVRPADGGVP